jgi:hypothetical protein
VREDWRKKLAEDAKKIQIHEHLCERFVFLCTATFNTSQRDEAMSFIQRPTVGLLTSTALNDCACSLSRPVRRSSRSTHRFFARHSLQQRRGRPTRSCQRSRKRVLC